MADLPYGRSAPFCLTRGWHWLHRAIICRSSSLVFSARGSADDLTLLCHSAEGMSRLVQVVADFCNWLEMRIKITRPVITTIVNDYGRLP